MPLWEEIKLRWESGDGRSGGENLHMVTKIYTTPACAYHHKTTLTNSDYYVVNVRQIHGAPEVPADFNLRASRLCTATHLQRVTDSYTVLEAHQAFARQPLSSKKNHWLQVILCVSLGSDSTNRLRRNLPKVKRHRVLVPKKTDWCSLPDTGGPENTYAVEYQVSKLHLGGTLWLLEVHRSQSTTMYMLESDGHDDYFRFSAFSESVMSYTRALGYAVYDCEFPEYRSTNVQSKMP